MGKALRMENGKIIGLEMGVRGSERATQRDYSSALEGAKREGGEEKRRRHARMHSATP